LSFLFGFFLIFKPQIKKVALVYCFGTVAFYALLHSLILFKSRRDLLSVITSPTFLTAFIGKKPLRNQAEAS